MAKDVGFYAACFGFWSGVLWQSFAHVGFVTAVCVGLAFVLLAIFSSLVLKKDLAIPLSLFTLALAFGIFRFNMVDLPPPAIFETGVGKTVSVSALIVDEPASNASQTKLIVETDGEMPKTGIVIFAKENAGFHYGDELQLTGILEKPSNFMTDQEMEFDYVNYLRKDGIFYAMKNPQIEVVSSGHGNAVRRWLFSWRERFDAALSKAVPKPESVVMGGIILGERYAFSQQLRQAFMDTGTIHIVTIGGYHVTLVAQWIMKIFSFLPKYAGIGAGMVSIFMYVVVTGGAQTSIRAGIMAGLALIAGATGRAYASGRALVLAGTVMIAVNPFVLAFDASFQLSFIATIAIIFLSPRLLPHLEWIPWKWLRDIVAITSSMYAFALPFVLYRMANLSLVSLPANILIVPLMPITMIAGFVTGFAGLVSPWLAIIPGAVAGGILYLQIAAVTVLSRLPFAAVPVQGFSLWIIIAIYVLFFWIFFKGDEKNGKLSVLLAPMAITFVISAFLYYGHYAADQAERARLRDMLSWASSTAAFVPDNRMISNGCKVNDVFPDHSCTPGAVFSDATAKDTCVKGYTATVRNVSTKTKKEVFEEYGLSYPQPPGAYEVDHFIPLALGGSNDIANLWPEIASPIPGFHEKDIVEVFLQGEVCSGRADLSAAQRQISMDWLAVYDNIPFEEKQAIMKKYGGSAVQ